MEAAPSCSLALDIMESPQDGIKILFDFRGDIQTHRAWHHIDEGNQPKGLD